MKKPPSSSLSSIPRPNPPRRRVFHNAYPSLMRGKTSELAKNRDAAAFTELMASLSLLGYEFESIIFNYAGSEDVLVPVDYHFIRIGDLIVMVTRPPLHDKTHGTKKHVPRSGTDLERLIFEAVGRWLEVCSRKRLRLADQVVAAWEALQDREPGSPPLPTPADLVFSQNYDARVKKWNTLAPGSRARRVDYDHDYRSVGFFLHLPWIEGLGCRLIVSFGMGSLENLIWNRIVRTRFSHWLAHPVVALAEMDLNRIPQDPVTLHFVENIPVKMLLEVPIEDSGASDVERDAVAA